MNLGRKVFGALLFTLVVALVFSIEFLWHGDRSYILFHDTIDGNIPNYVGTWKTFFEYGYSLWSPYVASGVDRLANGYRLLGFVDVLYALPSWHLGYQASEFLRYFFLVGVFVLFCVSYLRTSFLSAALVSIFLCLKLPVYDDSGIEFGIFTFPLVIVFLSMAGNSKWSSLTRLLTSLLFGFLYSLFFLHIAYGMPFVFIACSVWLILFELRNLRQLAVGIFGVVTGAFFALLKPILAAGMNSIYSTRTEVWGGYFTLDFALSSYRFYLEFYAPTIVAVFTIILILRFTVGLENRLKKLAILWIAVLCIPHFINYMGDAPLFKKADGTAVIPYFNWDRMIHSVPLITSILFVVALERSKFWKLPKVEKYVRPYGVLFVLFGLFLGFEGRERVSLALTHVAREFSQEGERNKVLEEIGRRFVKQRAESPFRVLTTIRMLTPDFLQTYGMETVGGYLAMYPMHYRRLWQKIIGRHGVFDNWPAKTYTLGQPNLNFNLLSLLNVGYVISGNDVDIAGLQLDPILTNPDELKTSNYRIYRNTRAFPRFFLASRIVQYSKFEEILNAMATADLESLRSTAFFRSEDLASLGYRPGSLPMSAELVKGMVQIKRYSADHLVVEVSNDGDAVLIVANSYSPFWKCRINGAKVPIARVDNSLWGVLMPRGAKQEVKFDYEPPYAAIPVPN